MSSLRTKIGSENSRLQCDPTECEGKQVMYKDSCLEVDWLLGFRASYNWLELTYHNATSYWFTAFSRVQELTPYQWHQRCGIFSTEDNCRCVRAWYLFQQMNRWVIPKSETDFQCDKENRTTLIGSLIYSHALPKCQSSLFSLFADRTTQCWHSWFFGKPSAVVKWWFLLLSPLFSLENSNLACLCMTFHKVVFCFVFVLLLA